LFDRKVAGAGTSLVCGAKSDDSEGKVYQRGSCIGAFEELPCRAIYGRQWGGHPSAVYMASAAFSTGGRANKDPFFVIGRIVPQVVSWTETTSSFLRARGWVLLPLDKMCFFFVPLS
jgi:hypothetical protein